MSFMPTIGELDSDGLRVLPVDKKNEASHFDQAALPVVPNYFADMWDKYKEKIFGKKKKPTTIAPPPAPAGGMNYKSDYFNPGMADVIRAAYKNMKKDAAARGFKAYKVDFDELQKMARENSIFYKNGVRGLQLGNDIYLPRSVPKPMTKEEKLKYEFDTFSHELAGGLAAIDGIDHRENENEIIARGKKLGNKYLKAVLSNSSMN